MMTRFFLKSIISKLSHNFQLIFLSLSCVFIFVNPICAASNEAVPPRVEVTALPTARQLFDMISNSQSIDERNKACSDILPYFYQYRALPEAVFSNHPEFRVALRDWGNPNDIGVDSNVNLAIRRALKILENRHIMHFWFLAQYRMSALCKFDTNDPLIVERFENFSGSLSQSRVKSNGHIIHILKMREPEVSPEAYFVGIVCEDEPIVDGLPICKSSRYFTWEHDNSGKAFFVELTPQRRKLYGPSNDLGEAAFLASIINVIDKNVRALGP